MKMKKIISLFLAVLMVLSLCACQNSTDDKKTTAASDNKTTEADPTDGPTDGSTDEATTEAVKKDPVKITMFHSNAKLPSGTVGGWLGEFFAEHGIILEIWAYSAEKFQAILVSGEYPDVMFFNSAACDMNAIIESGAMLDLNDYMDSIPSVRDNQDMQNAIGFAKEYVLKTDKLGALPMRIGDNGSVLNTGGKGIMINWELYEQIGKPEVKSLEDTIEVFKQMQAAKPEFENGQKAYAMHLFTDQDSYGYFRGISNVLTVSGYTDLEIPHFLAGNTATNEYEYILEDDGIYKYGLKYLNTLYREGLLNPDSITMDRATVIEIIDKAAASLCGWPIDGAYEYNGFMPLYYEGMRVINTGSFSAYGGTSYIGINAKSENIETALAFIDLIYNPDNMFIIKTGPEGYLWTYGEDGIPVLTEKGIERFVNGAEVDINGEAFTNFNITAPLLTGTKTSFGKAYAANKWPEIIDLGNQTETALKWKAHYGLEGSDGFVELLGDDCVLKAFDDNLSYFVEPISDEDAILWAAADDILIQASWKMVYAESDADFEKLWDDAVAECEKLGVKQLAEARKAALETAAEIEASLGK